MIYTSKFPEFSISDYTCYETVFTPFDKGPYPEDRPIYVNAFTDETITYGQLKSMVLQFAYGIQNAGLQSKDVVAIISPNEIEYPVVLHGIVAAGGVAAPIDSVSSTESLAFDLELIKAKFLIAHRNTLDRAIEAACIVGIPMDRLYVFGNETIREIKPFSESLMGKGQLEGPVQLTKEEIRTRPVFLYFTSGTTGGKRKAVILTSYAMSSNRSLSLGDLSNLRCLSITEFHHLSPLLMVVFVSLMKGSTTYIIPEFSFEALYSAVTKYRIEYVHIQPWVASAMVKDFEIDGNFDLSSIKFVSAGGAHCDISILRDFKEKLGIHLVNAYSATEMSNLALTADPILTYHGITGLLSGGYEARIIDEDGKDVPFDTPGELIVRGRLITPGYYNDPESTAAAIDSDGFYHTGDIFTVNESGHFVYIDRKKDMFKYKLYHIVPSEIEGVVLKSPKVVDCTAVGIYDKEFGSEVPRLYVMLKKDVENTPELAEELKEFVDQQVPDHYRLRGGLIILDELPRTTSGKIKRNVLRAM
ncbi:hypothetical protein BDB01DRAFT_715252 [Pilobolus umbonatus]|nr:hypothetical protein BDB01DRAFT_715252 [Pilobolus umbonatus]